VIDIQEKLLPPIHEKNGWCGIRNCWSGWQDILSLPIIVSTQYVKVLARLSLKSARSYRR